MAGGLSGSSRQDGCKEAGRAPREGLSVEHRAVKLQPWRPNGNCSLQGGSGLVWKGVAEIGEHGIERADPRNLVSSSDCIATGKTAYERR